MQMHETGETSLTCSGNTTRLTRLETTRRKQRELEEQLKEANEELSQINEDEEETLLMSPKSSAAALARQRTAETTMETAAPSAWACSAARGSGRAAGHCGCRR